MCLVADLEEIGLPSFAAEQIAVHFGKILPGAVGPEREPAAVLEEQMLEDTSELDLSEPRLCNCPEWSPTMSPSMSEPEPDEHSDALQLLAGKEDSVCHGLLWKAHED